MAALPCPYEEALSRFGLSLGTGWALRDWDDGALRWRLFQRVSAPPIDQGWKVHVAVATSEATTFLERAAPLLNRLAATFKLPRARSDISSINAGDGGAEQVGKILTLYPDDDTHARAVILAFDAIWPKSAAPAIRTSLHVRPGSAVAFRFGAFTARHILTDSRGVIHAAVRLPDGRWIADERVFGGLPPPGVQPPIPGYQAETFPPCDNVDLVIGDRNYRLLGELKRGVHTRLMFAADLASLQTAVVRQGSFGELRHGGKDSAAERIAREHAALQSAAARAGLAPRPLGIGAGDWPVLAMEDIRGPLLSDLSYAERMSRLPGLAEAVAQLHGLGWVHGDLKLENAIATDGHVTLIDFELAERIGEQVLGAGTEGYMAPELRFGATATPAQDVYSLGACLFHAVAGFPPSLLPPQTGLPAELLRAEGFSGAAAALDKMMAADPKDRPSAETCAGLIAHLGRETPAPAAVADHSAWAASAVRAAVELTAAYRVEDATGLRWRNEHFQRNFECEALNIGAAGILIGLLICSRRWSPDIDGAARWLTGRSPENQAAGLFTGNAGIALALAVAARATGRPAYAQGARARLAAAALDDRECDLFSGAAGVVFAAAAMAELLEETWPLDYGRVALRHLGDARATEDGIPIWGQAEEAFLGCAHGVTGIAAALGYWARMVDDSSARDRAVQILKAVARRERAAPGHVLGPRMKLGREERHAAGNWCHGAAGYAWAILAGPGPSADLQEELNWALDAVAAGSALATPTFCHGLAGHIELWRMAAVVPGQEGRAKRMIDRAMRSLRLLQETSGRGWISDKSSIITPDLWVGFMGPATALAQALTASTGSVLDGRTLRAAADEARHAG